MIETVLLAMRTIRRKMHAGRPKDLSVPQFRMLAFLNRRKGASLSDVAEHTGLALPSVSRAVDCLVKHGFVVRGTSPDDRRRVSLALTDEGRKTFQAVKDATRAHVADLLSTLSADERADIVRGMSVLRSALAQRWCGPECKH